jgi:hypothetical protein
MGEENNPIAGGELAGGGGGECFHQPERAGLIDRECFEAGINEPDMCDAGAFVFRELLEDLAHAVVFREDFDRYMCGVE